MRILFGSFVASNADSTGLFVDAMSELRTLPTRRQQDSQKENNCSILDGPVTQGVASNGNNHRGPGYAEV